MAYSSEFLEYVQDQLSLCDAFDTKKMFGGIGFFREGVMFGMIGEDRFRLRVDDTNRVDFETHGMGPLASKSKGKGMPYYEVPLLILEDREALKAWADRAYAVALSQQKK
ncbi:MAG: TfoX/Sxy family protein [Saprospiraceae bacterium]|nr:TfoX/Sxy family protein [Saprospiraceae bacterium]